MQAKSKAKIRGHSPKNANSGLIALHDAIEPLVGTGSSVIQPGSISNENDRDDQGMPGWIVQVVFELNAV